MWGARDCGSLVAALFTRPVEELALERSSLEELLQRVDTHLRTQARAQQRALELSAEPKPPCHLQDLTKELIIKCWPSGKVLVGRLLNKAFYRSLSAYPGIKIRFIFDSHKLRKETVGNALCRFTGPGLSIDIPWWVTRISRSSFSAFCSMSESDSDADDDSDLEEHLGDCVGRGVALAIRNGWQSLANISISFTHQGAAEEMLEALSGLERLKSLKLFGQLTTSWKHASFCQKLAAKMVTWKNLNTLALNGYSFGFEHYPVLITAIGQMQLQSLDLSSCRLDSCLGKSLGEALCAQSKLRSLKLCRSHLGDEGVRQISSFLSSLHSLTFLDLAKNGIREAGISGLSAALPSCTSLKHLILGEEVKMEEDHIFEAAGLARELDDNEISNAGAQCFVRCLAACTRLESLTLSKCKHGRWTVLHKFLLCHGLTELNLSKLLLQEPEFCQLAENFSSLGFLRKLCLYNVLNRRVLNHFATQDIQCRGFQHCTSLEDLDLGSNNFGGSASRLEILCQILDALPNCRGLQSLDLSDNDLSYVQVQMTGPGLGYRLQNITTLTRLSLGKNKMGEHDPLETVDHLTRFLAKNEGLKSLDLSRNHLEDPTVVQLVEALGACTQLEVLRCRDNRIGNQGASSFAAAMGSFTQLTEIDFERNRIKRSGIKKLKAATRKHPSFGIKLDYKLEYQSVI